MKESKRDDLNAEKAHRELESQARAAGKGDDKSLDSTTRLITHISEGIWNVAEKKAGSRGGVFLVCQGNLTDGYAQSRTVYHTMPVDAQGFINEWKGKMIDGVFA